MSDTLHADLSVALATRLSLQISLSSLAVVEEWMDPKLDRWLEGVPMPPELPRGGRVHFVVSVGSDLSRVYWGAYGHPAGFIPKLADYLSKCGVSASEVAMINAVGERFEPEQVGSWIAISAGKVQTGWQFVDELPLAELAPLAGADATPVARWCAAHGIERCVQFSRSIGDDPQLDIAVQLPGATVQDLARHAADAVGELVSETLDARVVGALTAGRPKLWLTVRASRGAVSRVKLVGEGVGPDVAAALCSQVGLGFDAQLDRLQAALAADRIDRVEYALGIRDTGAGQSLDVCYVPGSGEARARPN
jgi:hypothetical protein